MDQKSQLTISECIFFNKSFKETKSGNYALYFDTIEKINDIMISRNDELKKVKNILNFVKI